MGCTEIDREVLGDLFDFKTHFFFLFQYTCRTSQFENELILAFQWLMFIATEQMILLCGEVLPVYSLILASFFYVINK